MIPETKNPHRDYPQMAAERGRIEPAPRRVRGYLSSTRPAPATSGRHRTTRSTTSRYQTYAWSIYSTRTIHNGCSSALLACIR